MKIFWVALIFSLIFHLLQYIGISWAGSNYLKLRQQPEVVEIELASPTQPEQNEEARFVKAPEIQKTPPADITKPADIFSTSTQRFKKQMQAQKKGVFQNRSNELPQSKNPQPDKPKQKKFEFEDVVQSQKLDTVANNQWTFQSGQSQLEYNLPKEIPYGEITALDTDTHIYGVFYKRVVDLFYFRWTQKLDSTWNRLSSERKRFLSGQTWLTEVEITLNSDGVYLSGLIKSPSGFAPFDQAAITAFQSAQVFPNPPRGKIEPDGKVRLKYRVAFQIY